MKVTFTIAGLHPESGGPSQSVPALAGALGQAGAQIEIVSLHYGSTWKTPLPPPERNVCVTYVDCSFSLSRKLQWSPHFRRTLRERCRASGAEIIHDTGVWLATNHAAARVSAELKLPRIVSPRGMLAAWSLRHKSWKKKLAWKFYQRRDLETAHVLHATSPAEAADFRAAGLVQPIAVIPNGVGLPTDQPPKQKSEKKTLLFLGRIHPIKGLLDLVEAWSQARASGWRVVIAGGDEMNHRAEVEGAIRTRKLQDDFYFVGALDGDVKWNLYRQADIFVLPSHSENFGIVVAEALAFGVPVIATRGTPWEDLVTHNCGWWTDTGVAGLTYALRDALTRTDEERRAMGLRGHELVKEKLAWPGIAAQMHGVYLWMLGQRAKPDCIS